MSDDICDRLVRFSQHKQCMSTDLEVETAVEITRLREENARLREALKVAANFLDDAYTDTGRNEYKVAGFVARAAIWEGETK